jgi:hypothetical protein
MPIVFDLHNTSGQNGGSTLVLGFAGTNDEVEWQLSKAGELGLKEPSSLDYERHFWNEPDSIRRTSVLPSKITEAIAALGCSRYVARAGNGVIFSGGLKEQSHSGPSRLAQRLKTEFDPKHILPDLPS